MLLNLRFALYQFLCNLRLRFIKFLKKVAQFALALYQFYFFLAQFALAFYRLKILVAQFALEH